MAKNIQMLNTLKDILGNGELVHRRRRPREDDRWAIGPGDYRRIGVKPQAWVPEWLARGAGQLGARPAPGQEV